MDALRTPPFLAVPVPEPAAPFIGSQIELRSRFALLFCASALIYMLYLDLYGLVLSLVAVLALALEGGYKHFADNLRVLQDHNDEYQMMIDQQREMNQRLERDLTQFSGELDGMSAQNTELRCNVTQLESTKEALQGSVQQLQHHENELERRNQSMKASITELEASRAGLQRSVDDMREQNTDLKQNVSTLGALPLHGLPRCLTLTHVGLGAQRRRGTVWTARWLSCASTRLSSTAATHPWLPTSPSSNPAATSCRRLWRR